MKSIYALAIILRILISFGSFSGYNEPPIYGDFEV